MQTMWRNNLNRYVYSGYMYINQWLRMKNAYTHMLLEEEGAWITLPIELSTSSILIWAIFPFHSIFPNLSLSLVPLCLLSVLFSASGLSLLAITLKSKSIWMTEHRNFDNCEKGCYVNGLSIEGAGWSIEQNALVKSNNLQEPLPILHVIPTERHKLQTQVCKNCGFSSLI